MKQSVIDKFNAATAENDTEFERAQKAGFPYMYFLHRAQMKAVASGFLPQSGYLVHEARYMNSSDRVVNDYFAGFESIGDAHTLVGWCTPWLDSNMDRWKDVNCSLSCGLFDAGVVAAFTRAPKGEDDPLLRNGGWSVFGDVGIFGLREKAIALVREIGGDAAAEMMGEVGDCACLHLYADRLNSECVFKMAAPIREAYVRNACKAAYLAGAVFGEKLLVLRQGNRK